MISASVVLRTAAVFTIACSSYACSSSTDAGIVTNLDVRGNWHYTATQGAPSATLNGTLTISDYSGGNFSGKLDAQETDAQNVPRTRAGIVTGRTLSGSSIDCDWFLNTVARRHVGRLVADTMAGSWAEQGPGVTYTGTFRAVRFSR